MTGTRCNETDYVTIEASGSSVLTELVRGSEQRLLERVGPLVRTQCVSLDLGSVERIDAAGIAALISLYGSAREAGHRFTVSNATPRVAQILALVGLDRILLSHDAGHISNCGPRLVQSAA
jgi:anti-anti-sigma factor